MKELLRQIVNGLQLQRNNRVEAVPVLQPSSFVLIQYGQERRLNIDEKIPLDPGACGPEDKKMSFFVVSPRSSTSLRLEVGYGSSGYVNASWGYVPRHGTTKEKEWTATFTEHAFDARDGKKYIGGSNIYFNEETTQLHGYDWRLEYKPLDSKS